MPLRIAFDMDGVLADLASSYQQIEARLFGPDEVEQEVPETPDAHKGAKGKSARVRALRQKHEDVWRNDIWSMDFVADELADGRPLPGADGIGPVHA